MEIKTERECQWTAQPDAAWLKITDGASGQGPGNVQFSAAANIDPAARTGGIMVNGLRAQISQAAGECAFSLATMSASIGQAGGTGTAQVVASSPLCTWTASSDVDWVTLTAGSSGKGSSAVTFRVAATTGPPRTATLKIAGLAFNVTQSEGCTFSIAPQTYAASASGGSGSIAVATATGCPWTVTSNQSWITIASDPGGSGSGTAAFTVAATSGPSRTGTITIAGQTFSVTQGQGCSFALSSSAASVPAAGGTGQFDVRTADGCAWAAVSSAGWLTLTGATSGTGNGTVRYSAAENTGPQRVATITAGGQTFTVTQPGGCSYVIAPTSQNVLAAGGPASVAVTAATGCTWTATSAAPWISITSGAAGSGNGDVKLTIAANTGPARTGTVTIAGATFTVTQADGQPPVCTYTLSPQSYTAPSSAAVNNVSFTVTTGSTCSWTATSTDNWITINSPKAPVTGAGTVRFDLAKNNSGADRTGSITAGNTAFRVIQPK